MYEKILARWLAGKISEAQIDLLAKCGWLTTEQANAIKAA